MRVALFACAVALTGCTAVTTPPAARVEVPEIAMVKPTESRPPDERVTRYELGSYRYPRELVSSSSAILRPTRVPTAITRNPQITGFLQEAPSPAYAPLPASEELNAELAAQREISARLRAMEIAMAEVESGTRTQYRALLRQRGETSALLQALEQERDRLWELQAKLLQRINQAENPPAVAVASAPPSTEKQGPEW